MYSHLPPPFGSQVVVDECSFVILCCVVIAYIAFPPIYQFFLDVKITRLTATEPWGRTGLVGVKGMEELGTGPVDCGLGITASRRGTLTLSQGWVSLRRSSFSPCLLCMAGSRDLTRPLRIGMDSILTSFRQECSETSVGSKVRASVRQRPNRSGKTQLRIIMLQCILHSHLTDPRLTPRF